MKKIQTKTIYRGDKSSIRKNAQSHSICIFDDRRISFTDFRKAQAFLSKLNEFLNLKLFELNELYIELFTHYRRNWFYFEFLRQEEIYIINNFKNIDELMNLMINRGHFEYGTAQCGRWMYLSFKYLITIIDNLQFMHHKRNGWAEIKILESIRSRIIFILSQIETFE